MARVSSNNLVDCFLFFRTHIPYGHIVRRMFGSIGNRVVRLVRISIGPLKLESVSLGVARELSADEVERLRFCCGNSECLPFKSASVTSSV